MSENWSSLLQKVREIRVIEQRYDGWYVCYNDGIDPYTLKAFTLFRTLLSALTNTHQWIEKQAKK